MQPADVQAEKVDRAQEEQCDQQISDLAQKIMQVSNEPLPHVKLFCIIHRVLLQPERGSEIQE